MSRKSAPPKCGYCPAGKMIIPKPKARLLPCQSCGKHHWICLACADDHPDLVARRKRFGVFAEDWRPVELGICPEAWKTIEGVAEIGEGPSDYFDDFRR